VALAASPERPRLSICDTVPPMIGMAAAAIPPPSAAAPSVDIRVCATAAWVLNRTVAAVASDAALVYAEYATAAPSRGVPSGLFAMAAMTSSNFVRIGRVTCADGRGSLSDTGERGRERPANSATAGPCERA
jgi:hypothetical protein